MADRGKPIPFSMRQEIKEARQQRREPVRQVAERLGVGTATVQKYGKQKNPAISDRAAS